MSIIRTVALGGKRALQVTNWAASQADSCCFYKWKDIIKIIMQGVNLWGFYVARSLFLFLSGATGVIFLCTGSRHTKKDGGRCFPPFLSHPSINHPFWEQLQVNNSLPPGELHSSHKVLKDCHLLAQKKHIYLISDDYCRSLRLLSCCCHDIWNPQKDSCCNRGGRPVNNTHTHKPIH